MTGQWNIRMQAQSFFTTFGQLYHVTLETADQTVVVAGSVSKSSGDAEIFLKVLQNDLCLPEDFVRWLTRIICHRLWASLCEAGGDGAHETIDLSSFVLAEFGRQAESVLELIYRSVRTFQLLSSD